MFARLIQGRTSDAEAVRAALDTWMEDLRPDAVGWLGSTAGVADDGRVVAVARFESAEAAARNSERPEQSRWWERTRQLFDGEVTFADTEDVEVDVTGDPVRAGFVQAMLGGITDRERARALIARMSAELGGIRPDVLGSVLLHHGADQWAQVIWFTSEAAAREGERQEMPQEVQAVLEELMALSPEPPEFVDLRQPLLYSPGGGAADLPGPRASVEEAETAHRSR